MSEVGAAAAAILNSKYTRSVCDTPLVDPNALPLICKMSSLSTPHSYNVNLDTLQRFLFDPAVSDRESTTTFIEQIKRRSQTSQCKLWHHEDHTRNPAMAVIAADNGVSRRV